MSIIESIPQKMVHKIPEPEKVWIVISFRNAVKWIETCLESILQQSKISKINLLIIDDNSTDGSDEIINRYKVLYGDKITSVRNSERKYKLRNIISILDTQMIGDMDIIVFLDGDDHLASTTSIQTILDTYSTYGCWVTYGTYIHLDKTAGCCAREMTELEKKCNSFRKMPWIFSHLFTFRYFIWKSIPESYFHSDNDLWYKFAPDVIINLAICDIAKSSRIKFINVPLCVYNNISEYNENSVDPLSQSLVAKMAAEKQLTEYTLHPVFDYTIVIPYMNRLENLKITLKSIKESHTDKKINIIVVENSEFPEAFQLCKSLNVEYFYIPLCPDVFLLSKFNKCVCFDTAFLWGAPSKGYVCHDVDIFIPDNFWSSLEAEKLNFSAFQPYSNMTVNRLLPDATKQIHNGTVSYKEVSVINCFDAVPGSWGGSLYIDSNTYLRVGGYDSDLFFGYSPEDQMIVYKIGTDTIGFSKTISLFHQYHEPTDNTNAFLGKMLEMFQYMKANKIILEEYIEKKRKVMETI